MVEFGELDEDDVRNQIVTISNELRAVRDHSTLVLEGATRILLDLIRIAPEADAGAGAQWTVAATA